MSNETGEMPPEKIRQLTPKQLEAERRWTGRAILDFLREHSETPIHICFKKEE